MNMAVKVAKTHRPRVKEADEPRTVETLVRQLVACAQQVEKPPTASTQSGTPSDEEESGEVLVDCEIDGVRHACSPARTTLLPCASVRANARSRG
jgi:hypothetical protein